MEILISMSSLKLFGNYQEVLVILFFILFFYMLYRFKRIVFNVNLLVLIGFSLTYYLISLKYSQDVSQISIYCVLAYYIGLMLVAVNKNKDKCIIKYTYAIAIGFFIHAMLNYLVNVNSDSRNTIDFWTHGVKSASLQAIMLTMIMGTSFFSLICLKEKWKKIIFFICILFAILYDLILSTRTLLIVGGISIAISFIMFVILNYKNNRQEINRCLKTIFFLMLFVFIFYSINFLGIKNVVNESNFSARMRKIDTTEVDKDRVETQILSIGSLFEYPMGGNNEEIGNLKYAHNMWFDVAKQAGIIPFALLVSFFVINLRNLFNLIKNPKVSCELKIFLVGIYVAVLLNFFVEPIMQGEPLFFIMFCMVMGMVDERRIFDIHKV